MINKLKNKRKIKMILVISICILISFYIIYKLSSSLFMVITGAIILLIGSFVKDPELSDVKEEKTSKLEQLTIFSEEVLDPVIALSETNEKKKEEIIVKTVEKKSRKKNKNIIDIENTNSYKFDELDKKIKKSKKVKA